MAQKTEDPAVFTVNCKCPYPVPTGPPGTHPQVALGEAVPLLTLGPPRLL